MDNEFDSRPNLFLQTGECYLGLGPTCVSTVLGSCVAVTMFWPPRSLGAICHAFLPDSSEFRGPAERATAPCRFVDQALGYLLKALIDAGAAARDIEAKMFGGASGLGGPERVAGGLDIGDRNVRAARDFLDHNRVRLAASDVGGRNGRKLYFLTHTGEVWVRRLGGPTAPVRAPEQRG
ncbi:MAG: chemotaxis protein CheD [Desulfovibrionaceae bacterium]|nr:chemotaxis protein CheD [Desulfovibrionaceae bacterium]